MFDNIQEHREAVTRLINNWMIEMSLSPRVKIWIILLQVVFNPLSEVLKSLHIYTVTENK